jgi:tetratricopeptide (TPR) repeat protein
MGPVALQARYKEALCLLAMKRMEDARKLLETVATSNGPRWPLLAKCRLWALYLNAKRFDRARALFQEISARYPLEKLRVLVPAQLRARISQTYLSSYGGLGFLFEADPKRVEKLEHALNVLHKLNSPFWRVEHIEANLVRALELEGQREKAMDLARRVFAKSHVGAQMRV